MSSRFKEKGYRKRRSGKPYARKSVLEKVKDFFTPSYWFSGTEDGGDAAESGMTIEENAALMSSHQHSRTDSSSRQLASSREQQALVSGSTAWKRNLIVLNEDMETGPSWAFQNDADTVLRPTTDSGTQSSSQSSTNTLQHNTKLFIPTTSVSSPQHSSTPVKKLGTDHNLEVSPVQVERKDVTRKTETVQSSSDQQERTTRVEEGPTSTSPTVRVHQHGSMLTPPDSPTCDNQSSGVKVTRATPGLNTSSLISPGRYNIPFGQGPLRSPYYSGRTTFGGASSQVKLRTTKRRRSVGNQETTPELPPVRQQLQARPAAHQTVVASQTAKQILQSLKSYSTPLSNAKRFPMRSPVLSPKESVVPAAKRHRIKVSSPDRQQEQSSAGPPVNPLVTPSRADIITLPSATPLTTDVHTYPNPIAVTTTSQPISLHSSGSHQHTSNTSISSPAGQQYSGLQPFKQPWTNELVKVKEKPMADVGKSASDSFVTGWVGGAGSTGKMKEKKFSMHDSSRSDKDGEQVNQLELPKAVPLQLSSSGKLPSFSFMPAFLQKKTTSEDGKSVSDSGKQPETSNVTSTPNTITPSNMSTPSSSTPYNFSQPKSIATSTKSSANKEPVQYNFSTPKQHTPNTSSMTVSSQPSAPTLPQTQVFSTPVARSLPSASSRQLLSRRSDVSNSEIGIPKPLPLKSGSCLDILKPLKPVTEDKKTKEDKPVESSLLTQFKPPSGSWECPTCMINNISSNDKCVACGTNKPGAASTGSIATTSTASSSASNLKPPSGSWECPTCMINNKSSDNKCVACTTNKPGAAPSTSNSSLLTQFKPPSGSWECPTCMINNISSNDKCVACGTNKPGATNKDSSSTGFKIGASGGLQLGSGGGLKLGSGDGLKLETTKSDKGLSTGGGFKLPSGGLKLGTSSGLQLGLTGGLQLGSTGGIKLGTVTSGSDSTSTGSGFKLGTSGGLQLGSTTSAESTTSHTATSLTSSTGTTGSSLLTQFKPPSGSWECPTCMINNITSNDKCVACGTNKPGATSTTENQEKLSVATTPGTGLKLGTSGGFHLVGQSLSSKLAGGGTLESSGLLTGQQSLSATIKPISENVTTPSGGFKLPTNINPLVSTGTKNETTSGGLQLGSSGGLNLGAGGGLQLGANSSTGGLQLGSGSGLTLGAGGGLQLGTGGGLGVQLSLSNTIKFTSGEESTTATNNLGGMKFPLVGQKRSLDESDSSIDKSNTSLLSKPATVLPKTVTFKLDGDNKNNDIFSGSKQTSSGQLGSTVGVVQPILGGVSNQPQLANSENSSVKQPFANFFQQPSTTSSSLATFSFSGAKSTASSVVSGTSTTQTIPATTANLLNFTQGTQQSIFASPNQGQQSTFGVGLGKIPSKSESSGITMPTFFSGASKSSESSQGTLTSLPPLTQSTTSQPGNTGGFNFHAAMQNQPSMFNSSLVGSATLNTLNVTSSSSVFNAGTNFSTVLATNQVDNSGMEISHPVGDVQQQSTNLNTQSQNFQLQFGNTTAGNQGQPFVFGTQNQSMFSANAPSQTNIFGGSNALPNSGLVGGNSGMLFNAGGGQQAGVMFSATPSIPPFPNRLVKKAKRRTSGRP
ncbi:nuclear pore complex protein Nup153-like isoform X2 [Dysidea avara]|uniref:nuclear pore complex protein Nup153-like isoform X2 n=1 Tax=Dysidea avara TaxID=196820 RepID=UPI003317B134